MDSINLDYLCRWIGKAHTDEELISCRHARLMAATIDYPAPETIREGEPLPPLWHWTCFLEGAPTAELGSDGHPARGGFMPPVPLPNRMWAGGRVSFRAPLTIGAIVRKTSSIMTVAHKTGNSGDLVFVTVLHELHSPQGELFIREEQDIVYKDYTPAGRPPAPLVVGNPSRFTTIYTPNSTMLFRYSALTFNGHRIHYDVDYCRETEGYQNLVIHGPLNATMLAGYAGEVRGRRLREFSYRGLAPALLGNSITIHADITGDCVTLQATLNDGTICMKAEAFTD